MSDEGTALPGQNDLPGAAALIELTHNREGRGDICIIEFAVLPFQPQRFFTVSAVPRDSVRGIHAHRTCQQLLIALNGSLTAMIDDGRTRSEVRLESPAMGLYMPALTWGSQFDFSHDALLGVSASHPYDVEDYIDSYDEFLALAARKSKSYGN